MALLQIIDSIIDVIVYKCLSQVGSVVLQMDDGKHRAEGLETLRSTVETINTLMQETEERRYIDDDYMKHWALELKSISFDSNDLLDEYEAEVQLHTRKASSHARLSGKRKHSEILTDLVTGVLGKKPRTGFSSEIDNINNRLDDILKLRCNLRLRSRDGTMRVHRRRQPCSMHSLKELPMIVGREIERNQILEVLVSDLGTYNRKAHVPIVCIFGTAGVGKTTLAHLVYEDKRTASHFDFKVWVSLSGPHDVKTAMKEIFERVTNQSGDFFSFDMLQQYFREHMRTMEKKKFLLVIDNLWVDDYEFWEYLRIPLLAGGEGCKVLITTRDEEIGRIMPVSSHFELTCLDDRNCWEIIQSFAGFVKGENDHLVPIGMEIAKSCHGYPIAAKIIGSLLDGKDDLEWSSLLCEMRTFRDENNGILPSLKIIYHHLPYHLKQSLAYCCIFPNEYKFERDQMVRYWIAEGLVQPDKSSELEAVGNKKFDEFVALSLFERIPINGNDQGKLYKMPILISHLARLVSEDEFHSLECGVSLEDTNASRVRYASLLLQNGPQMAKTDCIESYRSLRTLKLCDEFGGGVVLPDQLFHRCKHLRVLDLSNSSLKNLPDSVGELIHLRYLRLSNTPIETLPDRVCDLIHLQTLELKGCLEIKELPQRISELINLRHLDLHIKWKDINDSTQLVIPEAVGHLKFLQTLSRFSVISSDNGKSCNICELNNLDLVGDLCILNLENVPTIDDALCANLRGKPSIKNLMLRWSESASKDQLQWTLSKRIIEALMPNTNLKSIWIVNYPGMGFPHWIGEVYFFRLEKIKISNSNNLSFLPLLGNLPHLKNLCIDNIAARDMVPIVGFPSLEHLKFSNILFQNICLKCNILPLRKFHVSDCPNLEEVVLHPEVYDKFVAVNCSNLSRIDRLPITLNEGKKVIE